jgi:hypothetical protein
MNTEHKKDLSVKLDRCTKLPSTEDFERAMQLFIDAANAGMPSRILISNSGVLTIVEHNRVRVIIGEIDNSVEYQTLDPSQQAIVRNALIACYLFSQWDDLEENDKFLWLTSAQDFVHSAFSDPDIVKSEDGDVSSTKALVPAIYPTVQEVRRWDLASNQIAKMLHDGLIDGKGWSENLQRFHMEFRIKSSKDSPSSFDARLIVGMDAMPPESVYSDPGTLALWMKPLREITDRFDPLRSDIHDILQIHWLTHRDADGWAVLNIADLMKYRDKRTWGNDVRHKDLIRYSDALRDVVRPHIEGQGTAYIKKNQKTVAETVRYTGPVWHYEIKEIPALFGPGLIEVIRYQPGTWLLTVVEPYAQQLMQRTPILLSLDSCRQELHKKIGKALDYLYRVNRGPVRITMRALLESARVDIPDWAINRRAGQFITKIEAALSDLYSMSALGEYDPQDILKELPARGKLEPWLNTVYTFQPMADMAERYKAISQHQMEAIAHKQQAARAARARIGKKKGA